jgi:hypothetical protein
MKACFSFGLLVTIFCLAHFAESEETAVDYLSVSETVQLAKTVRVDTADTETDVARKARANPDARPELYRILSDTTQGKDWRAVLRFFYFVGQDDDVPRIVARMEQKEGILDRYDQVMVTEAFYALAGIRARGSELARKKLDEMMFPDYWKTRKFRLHVDRPKYYSFENEMIMYVLTGRAYALEDDFPQKAQAVIARIGDPAQQGMMKDTVDGVIRVHNAALNGPLRLVKGSRLSVVPNSAMPEHVAKPSPQPTNATGTAKNSSQSNSNDDLLHLIDQALIAYERISKAFVSQEWDKCAPWMADTEKPLMPVETIRNEENIKAFVEVFIQKVKPTTISRITGILKEVKALELGPAEIEIMNTSKFTELDRGSGKYGPIAMKTTTIVRIPYLKSEALGQKYFTSPPPPRSRSITQDKQLIIMMIKIGDDWFWQPFGG